MSHDLPIESPIALNNEGKVISETAVHGASVDWLDQMLADPGWDILGAALINDEGKILARALNKSSGDTVVVLLKPGV